MSDVLGSIENMPLDDTSLLVDQYDNVAKMREALQAINKNEPGSAQKAIKNVTVLRIYHQLNRIVRYTSMMDKIEDKMYQSIDSSLAQMDVDDTGTWMQLVALQERLQRCMIESHKLLEPYLNLEDLNIVSTQESENPAQTFTALIQEPDSREKIRTSAQQLLSLITGSDPSISQTTDNDTTN